MDQETHRMKWWGWGAEGKTFGLENRPELLALLGEHIGPLATETAPVTPLDQIQVPDPVAPDRVMSGLSEILGPAQVSTERFTRLQHSLGKSYPDLIRVRRGQIDHAPDAV